MKSLPFGSRRSLNKGFILDQLGSQELFHNPFNISTSFEDKILLNLGPKFVPFPLKKQAMEFWKNSKLNLNLLRRRLELANFFDKEDAHENDVNGSGFFFSSSWNPPEAQPVRQLVSELKRKMLYRNRHSFPTTRTHGINEEIRSSIRSLSKNKDIAIVLTDKNLGFCILPSAILAEELSNWVTLSPAYEITNLNHDSALLLMQAKIKNLILIFGIKTKKVINFFSPKMEDCLLPYLHLLPKVHKTPLQWCPIIGAHSTPLTPASKFLTYALEIWLKKIENFTQFSTVLKNTTDLLKKLPKEITDVQVFYTADFSGLYNNLRHDEVLDAFNWLQTICPCPELDGFTFKAIIALLEIILKENLFFCQGKVYRQIIGIAMGNNAAVIIANLTLYAHELKAFREDLFPSVTIFGRYIDDIFFISHISNAEKTKSSIKKIYRSHHTLNWSLGDSVNFLDLTISKDDFQSSSSSYSIYKKI